MGLVLPALKDENFADAEVFLFYKCSLNCAFCKQPHKSDVGLRITSYNVCYTKLLRAPDITSRMVVGLINPTAEDDYTTTVDVVREDNLDMSSVVTPNVWYEYKIENIEVTEAFANGLGLDLWAGTLDSVTDDGGTVDFKDLMINFGEKALPWTELLEEFEWIMCRRYTTYMKVFAATSGYALGGGYYHFMQPIPSYMRATPTISGITVATFLTVAATGGNRALVQSTTAATTAGYQNALLDAEIY